MEHKVIETITYIKLVSKKETINGQNQNTRI